MKIKREVIVELIKGYINGSVWECFTRSEFEQQEDELLSKGWDKMYADEVITVYASKSKSNKGQYNWFTLIYQANED